MRWQDEPEPGDSAEEERTGYGRWEEEGGSESSGPDESGGAGQGAGGRAGAPNPGPSDGEAEEGIHGTCELCGGPTLERHCKILCLRCGYQRDCSDP